jgi:Zn-dependent protease
MESFIISLIIIVPSVIVASTIHEYAHALMAYKLGDYTAKALGRLTLNPISHIDPVGLLAMILSGGRFGWSKPVPIDERNYTINPALGTAIVAIAGPVSNLIIAALSGLFFRIFLSSNINSTASLVTIIFISINLSLALFNLIPIPPLDGSRIVRAVLPQNLKYYWEQFERYVPFIFIFIMFLPGSPFSAVIMGFLSTILNFLLQLLTGVSYF